MELYDIFTLIIKLFEKEKIEYAICGGLAVAFHGFTRFTKDIDILIPENNKDETEKLLKLHGFDFSSGIIPFDVGTTKERKIHRVSKIEGKNIFTVDLLIVNDNLQKIWETRETFEWNNMNVQVVSRSGLISMKKMAGRDQDLVDIKRLENIDE